MTQWHRWRGLKAIVHDSVNGASRAVERAQKETAKRWFDLLEAVPPLAAPARLVRVVHDGSTASVHGAIRLTNGIVAAAAEGVINALEAVEAKRQASSSMPAAVPSPTTTPEGESTAPETPPSSASTSSAAPSGSSTP